MTKYLNSKQSLMAPRYSTREMAEMVFCYGLANGNGRQARAFYAEKYPKRRIPTHKMFSGLFQRLVETGSLARPRSEGTFSVRTADIEERVLRRVQDDPQTSIRKIATDEGLSPSLVCSILHDERE
ncbi:uncharacterized protein LOC112464181 [Temnothorax curvispinosus]|uniref:Uncharacterized protein LOC112464181 n=1 Tax=Temnothorax curvispinosus TaxID=300111 RepID=A0A6J1QWW3_9HYME|nr:uncharacterized protein LOC112464181 [Temnothorax curvispinosus]